MNRGFFFFEHRIGVSNKERVHEKVEERTREQHPRHDAV